MLAEACDVVGAVSNGRALVAEALKLRPDVVVLDITMPLLNGVDAARQLKRDLPDVRIVFLTMNEDPELAAKRSAPAPPATCSSAQPGQVADSDSGGDRRPVLHDAAGHRGRPWLDAPAGGRQPATDAAPARDRRNSSPKDTR